MKNKLVSLLLAGLALAFAGCGTPTQNIATGTFLAGNAFATYELQQSPKNLKGLTDLSAALPQIISGKVTPFQMGVLNAELQPLAAAASAQPANATAFNQIGALISAAVQANVSAGGGVPTMNDAIATAALQDFALGIQHGIAFWQGQQSVTNPTPTQ